MTFATIDEAIEAIRNGEFVIVVDDADRENEGDLIIAAEKITEEKVAFMVRFTSGLICVPVTGQRLDELDLPLMVRDNTDSLRTAFTVSVDAMAGTTTGISAADRARTILALTDPQTRPEDLTRPGHIFPLRYREGGVLVRPGHTEASVDLARLAGLRPAGVLCEVVNDDGTMCRGSDLNRFAKEHDIKIISIADLVSYRVTRERLVARSASASLPTEFGTFRVVGYDSVIDGRHHVAMVMGDVAGHDGVLVRVHSECLTGDVLGSLRCDCGMQLREAQGRIATAGRGVVIYCRGHEGRGIGLKHKLRAYELQEKGMDTVDANLELGFPADARDYAIAAQILRDLDVGSVQLLTNNPDKAASLRTYGLAIESEVPLEVGTNDVNRSYLETKVRRLGHQLGLEESSA